MPEREQEIQAETLKDLKNRALKQALKVALGDGALGFMGALVEVMPVTRVRSGWVHNACNVLDKQPKKENSSAKTMLHDIWMAWAQAA